MQPYAQVSCVRRASPCPSGEEVKESGPECEKVSPVAQVFDQDQFASAAKHPSHLLKELHASFMMSKFVSGEDHECGIEILVSGRQRSPVRRGQCRLGYATRLPDRGLGHFSRIINVEYLSPGTREHGGDDAAGFIDARMDV